ncbi:DUF2177 family protein [Novosphingobium aquae]|uniref:DUF2177 family protein n=1 Tax=Novosphingobium aquae TaxID=3133435 RepID=A0ABU8S5M8_9SPHN
MKWVIAYVSAAVSFGVLDFLWLGWAGKNFYRPAIGELLAPSFRGGPALVFYAIYIAGIIWFAVRPGLSGGTSAALLNGALLGGLAYATYDLTNQATMKVWPVHVTVVDIVWGAFATAVAATVATWVTTRFAA